MSDTLKPAATWCQRFRVVADVYVEGLEGPLSEAEVAGLALHSLPYGRTLRLVFDPQQVEQDREYSGEPAPSIKELGRGVNHGWGL